MSAVRLSLEGLTKAFGGLNAVQAVDMELAEGVVLALVGPNGAGKTTLFNLITGQLNLDAGAVNLDGASITGLKPHQIARRGVARSFQDLRLFGQMTVRENVQVALEPASWFWQPGGAAAKKRRQEAAEAAIEQVGLTSLIDARAMDLSYAETKFLSLARILATGCGIWLLDEPASGLDPASRSRFVGIIRSAASAGVSMCVIEHNLDIVTEVADRIAFLDGGRKLAEGLPGEILGDKELIAIYFGEQR